MKTKTEASKVIETIAIAIAPGVPPFQLEGFPKKAQRSVKGALHLCGGRTKKITKDELETLIKVRPELVATKLRILTLSSPSPVRETPPPPPPVIPPVEDSPLDTETPSALEDSTNTSEDSDSGGKSKGRGNTKKKRS